MTEPVLVNVTEEIVRGLVSFLLQSPDYQTFCHCELCVLDTVAVALNTLPSKYVVSKESRDAAFAQANRPENIEYINKQIIRAIHLVAKNPHHLNVN